ncbi:hypothetical protein OH77DRAFT_1398161 [Trametes cingulata]|nr:hypothetical protein OH77DRAFT_1398161 [Trametes cingulata]
MVALPCNTPYQAKLIAHRIYIIDFDIARQFPLGPGAQPAIVLPETQPRPPNGLTEFDPYSWDVYCLGWMLEYFLKVSIPGRTADVVGTIQMGYTSQGHRVPWIARRYVQWLVGDERGCTGVCRCRPTAKTARRVLTLIQWVLPVIEIVQRITDLFSP